MHAHEDSGNVECFVVLNLNNRSGLISELNNGIPVYMHTSFHGLHYTCGLFSAAFCELLNHIG